MFISKKELEDIREQLKQLNNSVSVLTTFKHLTEANMSHLIKEINAKLLQKKQAPAILNKPVPKKRGRPVGSKNAPKKAKV